MNSIDFLQLELHEKVGEGSYGSVWRASYLGTPVAVKECIPNSQDKHAEFISYFEREAEMLSKSRHPNIVQFLGTCVYRERFWIVTEYISCGTMKSWIIDDKVTSLQTRLNFAIDIARALTYLHSYNIIHRDLKPSNLLITESKRVKICDFGFARSLSQSTEERKRMSFCGTVNGKLLVNTNESLG
ncbi:hypothetical protein DSO57_1028150 [Entomophthora muscae]|uniref:Uncharacterized protein n=1 Tax=Entomophthora muscae TaxID=34485 RepID=A0ACC2SEG8_9FUNG|nr:hypothetical protein DSO57_1028150 [Entomophthora muscae]